jgi:hypothetical protein
LVKNLVSRSSGRGRSAPLLADPPRMRGEWARAT